MTNRTVFILFVLGFILWYANRKNPVVSPTPSTEKPNGTGLNLVASSPTAPTTTAPITGMVNGVPNWLKAIGQSRAGSTNETSFYLESDIAPNVRFDIVGGGTASGVGWSIGTTVRATPNPLRNWNYVVRLNPTVLGIGGILNNKSYYATISNPNVPAETITVQFTTANGDSVGTPTIALVPATMVVPPVVAPPVVVTPPVVPVGSSAEIDAYLSEQVVFTGEKRVGFDTNPAILQIDATLIGGKVYPLNSLNFTAPAGYFLKYQIENVFYDSFTEYGGGEQGMPILVTMFVVINGTTKEYWTTQNNHHPAYRAAQSSISIF